MAREVRKLQQVGGGTYTVSIPKGWALEHGMEAGSDVHLYPHADGSLVVRGSATDGGALVRTRLDVTDLDPAGVERLLRAAHVVGFETITVGAEPLADDQRRAVRRATRTFVGTEPVEECEHRVRIRNLLDASEVSVGQSLLGMRSVVLSTHRTATAMVEGDIAADPERLRRRRHEADRSFEMIARHLNRSFRSFAELDRLGIGRPGLFDYYCTGRELDRVADHAIRLAEIAGRTEDGSVPSAALAPVAAEVRAVVDVATTAVIEGATDRAEEALDRRDDARERIAEMERERTGFATTTLRALDCLRRTAAAGGQVAETALRRTARPREE